MAIWEKHETGFKLVENQTIYSGITDKMWTCVEMPKDSRNIWNQPFRQKRDEVEAINYISENWSILRWLLFYLKD